MHLQARVNPTLVGEDMDISDIDVVGEVQYVPETREQWGKQRS